MFQCKRCLYQTAHKHVLKAHLTKRKKECEVVESGQDIPVQELLAEISINGRLSQLPYKYECEWCGTKFTQASNKSIHKRICKVRPTDTMDNTHPSPPPSDPAIVNALQNLTDVLTKQHVYGTSTYNNITNIKNNIHVNVQLPSNFGEEKVDVILEDKPFLTDCVMRLGLGIKELLERIHFQQEQTTPNAMNFKNFKVKQKTVEVLKDGNWQLCDQSTFLKEMIDRGYRILYSHFLSDLENNVYGGCQEQINKYYTRLGESLSGLSSHNEYWQLRKDVLVMVHNNTLYLMQKIV